MLISILFKTSNVTDMSLLKLLLSQLNGSTPLMCACTNGRPKMAALLIEHGAVIDYENKVRLLYVHGGHGVAQNGVLSLE